LLKGSSNKRKKKKKKKEEEDEDSDLESKEEKGALGSDPLLEYGLHGLF
jgi:hypothetical protein